MSLALAHNCINMLIPSRQANVIIDQKGRARLAEYGFAPLRFGPGFMAAGIPRAVGVARRLAPELLKPPRDGNDTPVTESGPADVFAFAMLAVEVFTGNVPFEEQKNEAVILRISLGGRPEMPGDAQTMGLTAEMWELLGSCWQQDPEERPTMEEVVKRWEKFVEYNDDDSDVFTRCVYVPLVIRTPPLVPFLTVLIGNLNPRMDRSWVSVCLARDLRPPDPERRQRSLNRE